MRLTNSQTLTIGLNANSASSVPNLLIRTRLTHIVRKVHGLAPVRQVEDSEDEVAKDISLTEVSKPPVAHGWIECQECTFLASTQEVSDLHSQSRQHHRLDRAPTQASNTIEEAELKAHKMDRAVQASMSVEVAEDISTREMINPAPHSIEEAEFKAHKMDGAEVQVSMSVEVAPDIPTREIVKIQGNTAQPIQKEVATKQVDTVQPIQQEVVPKKVDTAQPIHQEVATKKVDTK